jgi:hypothetical protein
VESISSLTINDVNFGGRKSFPPSLNLAKPRKVNPFPAFEQVSKREQTSLQLKTEASSIYK